MAYDKNNPPAIISSAYGGVMKVWALLSGDNLATLTASDYISNAEELGMGTNDVVIHSDPVGGNGNMFRVNKHTVTSTAVGAKTATTGFAKGDTTITLGSVGTGAIVATDVVMFGNDPTRYRVTTGDADVSGGGSIVISPALQRDIPAKATDIHIVKNVLKLVRFTDNDTV